MPIVAGASDPSPSAAGPRRFCKEYYPDTFFAALYGPVPAPPPAVYLPVPALCFCGHAAWNYENWKPAI